MLLVTGITGHTGRYFLQELINHKYEGPIRCIVRETSDTSLIDSSGLNIEKVYGDINDEEFVLNALNGVKEIIHIYNIHHSPMIVKAAINNRVKRATLVHTTGIYSNFKSASRSYIEIEKKIIEMISGPDCPTAITILRPTMIYGDICDSNMSKFIWMIDRFRVIPVINGGRSLIQPVNARDLGKAYYAVLMSPEKTSGKTYDLSGDKPLQMIDAFSLISKNLKKRTLFLSIPLSVGVIIAQLVKLLTFNKIDITERVQRMGENRSYPHFSAEADFNFKPMSFEKGIELEVSQYLKK